ncbi:MAG: ATP-dependent DNA helicase RecQ [Methylococcaceae bacterium]
MQNSIQTTLLENFGFDSFRPGQQEVVEFLLAGHSSAAVFPTGGGKSLCYQLPALMLPGVTLVVSPLIALMKDQIDALTVRGIAARRLDSTLTADEYREVMDEVRHGALRMLYVAPERFNNERFRESIRSLPISLFAVDEAHCISEWGHNFRPDYLKLAGFAREFNAERVLALTATATSQVLEDICQGFNIKQEHAVRTGFYRSNLTLLTESVTEATKIGQLLSMLKERPLGPTIIYVTLQKTAEYVAQQLQDQGLSAHHYHAGMKDEARASTQEWFMSSDQGIVVATIAFGMGIDKSDIRYVYHYNLPKSLENYAQEIGRAGRDGKPSTCQILASLDDLNVLENFIYGDTPSADAIKSLMTSLFAQDQQFDLNLYAFSSEHDIRILVLRTLLTYLELDGFLQGGTPFYADYSFKPLKSSHDILQQFKGERRLFLSNLFKQASKARTWFHIDPNVAAMAMSTDRERVIRALDWLAEQQMLELKVAGIRHRYQRLKMPDSAVELAEQMYLRIIKREAAEISRLQQVLEFVEMDSCQTTMLAAHFDEVLKQNCGHCAFCNSGKTTLPDRKAQAIPENLREKIMQLINQDETAQILKNPHILARFLCGVTSPHLSKAKLTKHSLFSVLENVPFKQVQEWVLAPMPLK